MYNILKSELYSGTNYEFRERWKKISQTEYDIKHNPRDEWVAIQVPAIVSRELQAKVIVQLDKNYKLSHRNTRNEYLLTGIIKCGICGMGMVAVPGGKKNQIGYYICYGKRENKSCPDSKYVPIKDIESGVWDCFLEIAKGDVVLADILGEKDDILDRTSEIEKHVKKENELTHKRNEITNWFMDNLIDSFTAKKKLNEINKELNSTILVLSSLRQAHEKSKKKYSRNKSIRYTKCEYN